MRYLLLASMVAIGCGPGNGGGGDDMGVGDLTMLPEHCSNSTKDVDETDVDCGGGSCPACTTGKGCKKASDCSSLFCANNLCDPPACDDGVRNGDESDTDCGGSCTGCAVGRMCGTPLDCMSLSCTNGMCVTAACMNGKKGGNETDVDCGGGMCPKCANGKTCLVPTDCESGQCTNNTCKPPVGCTDAMKNGAETDVDCGGGMCPTCADGKMCVGDADCMSGKCSGNVCVKPNMCMAGKGDCDGNPNNGCEVTLNTDPKNCGMCGKACLAPTAECHNGACSMARVVLAATSKWPNGLDDVKTKLSVTNAFAAVDIIDVSVATPLLGQLQAYDAVLSFTDGKDALDLAALGNVLADYFDAGGRVVIAPHLTDNTPIGGRWGNANNGYLLMQITGLAFPNDSLGNVAEPMSPLMKDVFMLTSSEAYGGSGMAINGGVVVASWKSGRPLIVRGVRNGRAFVELNLLPVSADVYGGLWKGDGAIVLRNALLYQ